MKLRRNEFIFKNYIIIYKNPPRIPSNIVISMGTAWWVFENSKK